MGIAGSGYLKKSTPETAPEPARATAHGHHLPLRSWEVGTMASPG